MLSIRWSYNAFLKYIRKQVMEFSKVISSRMIKNELFHTLPYMKRSSFNPITLKKSSFATNL